MNRSINLALRGVLLAAVVALGMAVLLTVGGDEGSARTDLAGMHVTALSSGGSGVTVYAAVNEPGAAGLYRSSDGGRNWQVASRQLGKHVNALAVASADYRIVYAGTSGGSLALQSTSLYLSKDAGRTWDRTPLGLPANAEGNVPAVLALAADRSDPGTLYVGTDGQGIYKLTDNGVTLTALGDGFNGGRVYQIVTSPGDSRQLYAVTSTGLFESENSGEHWAKVQSLPEQAVALAVAPSDHQVLYAGTTSMGAYRSLDGGNTWRPIGEGLGLIPGVALSVTSLEVDDQDPFLVYATASYLLGTSQVHEVPLGVYVSEDGGDTWRALPSGGSAGRVNAVLKNPGANEGTLLGTDEGVFWADRDGISEVRASTDDLPAAFWGDEFGSGGAFDRVSIILLIVVAVAIVIHVKPVRLRASGPDSHNPRLDE
jgi:hypothetical protein